MSIYNYEISYKENGEWVTDFWWIRPILAQATLDESLDEGVIKFPIWERRDPLKPFTPVRFKIYEINRNDVEIQELPEAEQGQYLKETRYFFSATDSVEQHAYPNEHGILECYHTIQLIELSKSLERDICDTLTFTHYLNKDYYRGGLYPVPECKLLWHSGSNSEAKAAEIMTYYHDLFATFPITSPQEMSSDIELNCPGVKTLCELPTNTTGTIEVFKSNGSTDESKGSVSFGTGESKPLSVTIREKATYKIVYTVSVTGALGTGSFVVKFSETYVIEFGNVNSNAKPFYTITSAVNRILSTGVTRKHEQPQKYTLDPAFAAKYNDIECPELHIPQGTLFEALAAISNVIHAIPRLKWNEAEDKANIITFDELSGTDVYTPPADYKDAAYSAELGIDEYTDEIDSNVENIINTKNRSQGAITEPTGDTYRSMRCEEGSVEISDSTANFVTEYPIYRIENLTLRLADSGKTLDITPYVYEQAEYDALSSSVASAYPYSKKYALKFSQGDNKITCFNFKLDGLFFSQELFGNGTVIRNILSANGMSLSWMHLSFNSIIFRITYIPMISMRVKQRKPYKDPTRAGLSLIYNQSANMVESESYGENLRGTIARLGNGEQTRTGIFYHYDDIPKIGQIWDGMYIAKVACDYELERIKATVLLVENFNRLAQYLGIFTNYRLYDVSEKQSFERQVNCSEEVVIGDEEAPDNTASITSHGLSAFKSTFSQTTTMAVTTSVAQTLNKNLMPIKNYSTVHGCASFALGNSIIFSWGFHDNYSAGYKSADVAGNVKHAQENVPYGDVYGEFYALRIKLCSVLNAMVSREQADSFPEFYGEPTESLLDFTAHPLIVEKDSREHIRVTHQLHFRTNRRSMVIGSALAQNCALVSPVEASKAAKLYVLPRRLNPIGNLVNMDGGQLVRSNVDAVDGGHNKLRIEGFTTPAGSTYQSWAIVSQDEKGQYRLLIGENRELPPATVVDDIYFNFKGR